MTLCAWLGLLFASFVAGGVVAHAPRARLAVGLTVALLLGLVGASIAFAAHSRLDLPIAFALGLIALLGIATVLSRPAVWREPRELGRLVETALLVAVAFAADDLVVVAAAWLLSIVPGLRGRQQREVSRRPLGLLAVASGLPVLASLLAWHFLPGADERWIYAGLVVGGAFRMGVFPLSVLLLAGYERLPLGRAALVAAARPTVALLVAARAAFPAAVEPCAPALQAWAATAALLVALQGLSTRDPRRSVGVMAATQAAIVLYGLVSPGPVGLLGALVQWAGLGLSLVGLGVVVEAIESRLGRRRTRRVTGLLSPAPGMALVFLVFAATMSGFPGTSGFAGEDLIMQAPAVHGGLLRLLLLLATALNGVTMLRLFAGTFMGPLYPPEAQGFPSLTTRERLVLASLAFGLVCLLVWPDLVER